MITKILLIILLSLLNLGVLIYFIVLYVKLNNTYKKLDQSNNTYIEALNNQNLISKELEITELNEQIKDLQNQIIKLKKLTNDEKNRLLNQELSDANQKIQELEYIIIELNLKLNNISK